MKQWGGVLLILGAWAFSAMAIEREKPVFTSDNEYIFNVQLKDGPHFTEGIVLYRFAREWYIPLYEFTSKLGLSFSFSSDTNTVQGDVIDESRHLSLNLTRCVAKLRGDETPYDCSSVVQSNDEIYIAQRLFETWFPLSLTIMELQSQMLLETKDIFPAMAKMKRAEEGAVGTGSNGELDYGFPTVFNQRRLIDAGSQDIQIGTRYSKVGEVTTRPTNYQTSLSTETAGLESHFDLIGDDREVQSWYLNFRKMDEKGEFLGPLQAKQMNLYHLYFPSFPLVGGNELVRGVSLTNASLDTPTQFSSHDFEGDLLPGWDVELYQNGLLIRRQLGTTGGQYSFSGVPLLYGINRFQLVFYGPQGQIRHEYKTFRVDASIPSDQRVIYRAATAVTESGKDLSALSFEKALSRRLSLHTSYSEAELSKETPKRQYATMGLNGFANAINYSLFASKSIDYGEAYQGSLMIPYYIWSLKFDHTQLSNYRSLEFSPSPLSSELRQREKAELFAPLFGRLITRTQVSRDYFRADSKTDRFLNYLSMDFGLISLGNEEEWASDREQWITSPYLYFRWWNTSWRLSTKYQENMGLMNYRVEGVRNISDYYDLMGSYVKPLIPHDSDEEYSLSLTRYFVPFSVSLQSTYQRHDQYSVACNVNIGLVREPRSNAIEPTRKNVRDRGSLSALVFEDRNQNGIHDPDETVLPNVGLRILETNQTATTNSEGIAFFTDLRPYIHLDVAVMPKTLPNIQYRPIEKGYRFVSSPGRSNLIEIPIGIFGEIDGAVSLIRRVGAPVQRGINVQLIDSAGTVVMTTRTDRDGYYLFEGVRPGAYRIDVRSTLDRKDIHRSRDVLMPPTGDYVGGMDFRLTEN